MNESDLMKFCSADKWRSNLQKPWSLGDYSYATNGHILIRVPRIADIPEIEKPADVDKVCRAPEGELTPIIWGTLPPAAPEPTERIVDCDECDGSGSKAPCGCDCAECVCDYCDGKGKVDGTPSRKITSVRLRGTYFDAKYLHMLRDTGPVSALPALEPAGPCYFKGDGFEIFIMARREDSAAHDAEKIGEAA